MTVSETLAGYIERLGDCASNAEVAEAARMHFADTVACIAAGSGSAAAAAVASAAAKKNAAPTSTALCSGGFKTGVHEAAMINTVSAHCRDYDDMSIGLNGHASAVLVPVCIALGEQRHSSGRDVLNAYIAGVEADSLLGKMLHGSGYYKGWNTSCTVGTVGAAVAADAVKELRKVVYEKSIQRGDDVKQALRDILEKKLEVGDTSLDLSTTPSVVLIIGVNGVGKTTSIGKLANRYKKQGKRVLLCAADTFRAAAADQLEIWADRADVEIVRSREGADPGAVLFDSLQAAKARNVDVVFCDTAGRLHNKVNLMQELSKLRKIIDRETPDAAKETLLVLDATTGQNGLQQAKVFRETAGLTGIILTKLDGTAKGGICVAIAQELGVPVKFVGLGEGIDDLQPFDAKEYVNALI